MSTNWQKRAPELAGTIAMLVATLPGLTHGLVQKRAPNSGGLRLKMSVAAGCGDEHIQSITIMCASLIVRGAPLFISTRLFDSVYRISIYVGICFVSYQINPTVSPRSGLHSWFFMYANCSAPVCGNKGRQTHDQTFVLVRLNEAAEHNHIIMPNGLIPSIGFQFK